MKRRTGYKCDEDIPIGMAHELAKKFNPTIHQLWRPQENDRIVYRNVGIPFRLNKSAMYIKSLFTSIRKNSPASIVWFPSLLQSRILLTELRIQVKEQKSGTATFLILFDMELHNTEIRRAFDYILEAYYDAITYAICETNESSRGEEK